ncbi:hypothetical protein [Vulcanisaeta sp. JCM 16159]|uniref:hypothetical protein n=1 Tax=Vulcanisaeta sp. JCM 16159 TaxID=1295371 RepID=UPI000A733062|nr:hypothetical protein [Vulcanisaeta sp. JCM 16159]
MIDYAFYKRVMEFLARYLGLENEPLYMKVLRYDNVLNGVKVLIAIYRVRTNELITCCAVRFDNTMGKAERRAMRIGSTWRGCMRRWLNERSNTLKSLKLLME